MHLSWLDPHKMRKMTVVGRDKMVVFDDMELERKVTIFDKAARRRRRPTASGGRGRATSTSRRSRTTSRCASSASTSSRLVAGEGDRAQAAHDGLAVVRALERLQASLVAASV